MNDKDDLDAIREIVKILTLFEEEDRHRIYRWVGEKMGLSTVEQGIVSNPEQKAVPSIEMDPRIALKRALDEGDLSPLPELAQKMKSLNSSNGFIAAAAALASAGVEYGEKLLIEALQVFDLDEQERHYVFGTLVNYYTLTDKEAESANFIEDLAYNYIKLTEDDYEKAFYFNQLGRLYFGAGERNKSLKYQKKAASLNTNEPAYVYNLALVLSELGRREEALVYARRIVEIGSQDPDHYELAIKILSESEKSENISKIYEKLESLAPNKAKLLLESNKKVRSKLLHSTSPKWFREG